MPAYSYWGKLDEPEMLNFPRQDEVEMPDQIPQMKLRPFRWDGCSTLNRYIPMGTRLLEHCFKDVVFVSIYFLNNEGICGKSVDPPTARSPTGMPNYQLGIAILDTRHLDKPAETAVTTRQFCVGTHEYCDSIPTRLIFGDSETVTSEELSTKLTELLRFVDPTTNTLRPIAIISYKMNGLYGQISCLNRLADPRMMSPIIDHLDIDAERVVLGCLEQESSLNYHDPGMEKILKYLAIPFANLRLGGNNAMFNLRAAIMITVRQHHNIDRNLTYVERKTLSKLQDLALVPLSPPPGMPMQARAFGRSYCSARAHRPSRQKIRANRQRKQERKQARNEACNQTHEKERDWPDMNDFAGLLGFEDSDLSTFQDQKSLPSPESCQRQISSDSKVAESNHELSDEKKRCKTLMERTRKDADRLLLDFRQFFQKDLFSSIEQKYSSPPIQVQSSPDSKYAGSGQKPLNYEELATELQEFAKFLLSVAEKLKRSSLSWDQKRKTLRLLLLTRRFVNRGKLIWLASDEDQSSSFLCQSDETMVDTTSCKDQSASGLSLSGEDMSDATLCKDESLESWVLLCREAEKKLAQPGYNVFYD